MSAVNMNMSLSSLEHLVSGYYNKGDLKVEGDKIVAVNNHVHQTSKNNVQLSPEDNVKVRNAVYSCFETAYGNTVGMEKYLTRAKAILLGRDGNDPRVTEQPLSRDEVRALVKALFRMSKAVAEKSWRFAGPQKLAQTGNEWFNRAEVISGFKRGHLEVDTEAKMIRIPNGRQVLANFEGNMSGEALRFLGKDGVKIDSNIFRGWCCRASVQKLLMKQNEEIGMSQSAKAKAQHDYRVKNFKDIMSDGLSIYKDISGKTLFRNLRMIVESDTFIPQKEKDTLVRLLNALEPKKNQGDMFTYYTAYCTEMLGNGLDVGKNSYMAAISTAINQMKD